MIHCLIITKNSEVMAKALERALPNGLSTHLNSIPRLQAKQPDVGGWTVTDEFNRIADWIERTVAGDAATIRDLRDTLIMADIWPLAGSELKHMNPVAPGDVWAQLMAMLVLAFPEVQWVYFGGACGTEGSSQETDPFSSAAHCLDLHNLSDGPFRLHQVGFTPLFDPTGLRNAVRNAMVTHEQSRTLCHGIPQREQVALAIDEERSYALFHGYVAYRFGFRSHVVTTFQMMKDCLLNKDSRVPLGEKFLTIEDLYLKFSEQPGNRRYSILSERDREEECPRLKEATYRIIVTSGHGRLEDRIRLQKTKEHLRTSQTGQDAYHRIVFKPLAGIFDFWRESGLKARLHGHASDFKWPPPHPSRRDGEDDDRGHSAPGRLLEIANRLIDRAERLLPEVHTVADCVHGAVLATDASELLAGRTPTITLEALVLKHQFEALAECQFYGVRSTLDVKARLHDVQKEVKQLAQWFSPKGEAFARWNAEAAILNKLILIYREHNRVDEENQAVVRSRTLNRLMWFHEHRWAAPAYPVAWYIEFLLSSLPRFIAAIVIWVAALSALYRWMPRTPPGRPANGLYLTIGSFFAIQPPPDRMELVNPLVVGLAIISGFVHLGIFISHLYSVVSRK